MKSDAYQITLFDMKKIFTKASLLALLASAVVSCGGSATPETVTLSAEGLSCLTQGAPLSSTTVPCMVIFASLLAVSALVVMLPLSAGLGIAKMELGAVIAHRVANTAALLKFFMFLFDYDN